MGQRGRRKIYPKGGKGEGRKGKRKGYGESQRKRERLDGREREKKN